MFWRDLCERRREDGRTRSAAKRLKLIPKWYAWRGGEDRTSSLVEEGSKGSVDRDLDASVSESVQKTHGSTCVPNLVEEDTESLLARLSPRQVL